MPENSPHRMGFDLDSERLRVMVVVADCTPLAERDRDRALVTL
jgi:hypothetical protein